MSYRSLYYNGSLSYNMDINVLLNIIQIISGILLIGAVLLQPKGEGMGGGSGIAVTRRGAEKVVFNATIILAAVFLGVSVARLFL